MTIQRLDVLATREYQTSNGETKTSFTRLGVALPTKRGDGYTLLLDAMPAPTEGQYKMLLMPPKPRDGQQQNNAPAPDLNDEVPW